MRNCRATKRRNIRWIASKPGIFDFLRNCLPRGQQFDFETRFERGYSIASIVLQTRGIEWWVEYRFRVFFAIDDVKSMSVLIAGKVVFFVLIET